MLALTAGLALPAADAAGAGPPSSAGERALFWLRARADHADAELKQALEHARKQLEAALLGAAGDAAPQVGVQMAARDGAGKVVWSEPPEAVGGPRLVLLVHGLDEPGDIWADLTPALLDAGVPTARFDYPNDQPARASADLLAEALADLRRRGVERVDLVGHSMGGLIARDVLTRDAEGFYRGDAAGGADLPRIDRLFLVATPNAGAPLAPVRLLLEVREQVLRMIDTGDASAARWVAGLADGHGEAGDDLCPGSVYLTELNRRPRPGGLTITCIVARIAPEEVGQLEEWLDSSIARAVLSAAARAEARAMLHDAAATLGDGAVPLGSAVYPDADETVEVTANHRSVLKRFEVEKALRSLVGEATPAPPGVPVIVDRVKTPAGDDGAG